MRVFWWMGLVFALGLGYFFGARRSEPVAPDVEEVVAPTVSVVTALRDVARLEGAVAHIERVIDLKEKQSRFAGLVKAEDAILLVASGEVTAGVDFAELADRAVKADRVAGRVRIELPPARILSQKLDSGRTYVHTRNTDVLARRQEDLETRARQEAERTLAQAAIEPGILRRAEENVGRTVTSLLHSLGFAEVEILFAETTGEISPPKE